MMKPSMASAVPNEKRHEMKKWEGNFCGPYLIYACIYLVRAQVSDACKVRLTFFPSILVSPHVVDRAAGNRKVGNCIATVVKASFAIDIDGDIDGKSHLFSRVRVTIRYLPVKGCDAVITRSRDKLLHSPFSNPKC
ncbi:predicted protein [Sclerotinia sclerotiorum 1980 UF-70]|uniref:Uncharacterized protein n=1 Tax=Sclerotinia sclerotiorum (strain ATCC 18683 / 1980 / Ss-1) TaxID=665079 RepID=A7EXW6_SCLS1|nr:predicted protein [Sclerotinia sclerotiorum 1980 UF-70]EDN94308.1 predicted protein [Sclerotinia sclerotiorum 1980 UF-70]